MSELLAARKVTRRYGGGRRLLGRRPAVTAVDDVSLAVQSGEALGLVGESGSGKTTLGRMLCGLESPTSGHITLEGRPLAGLPRGDLWRRVQFVHADPQTSFNPRKPVGAGIALPLAQLEGIHRRQRPTRVAELFERVALDPDLAHRYPHQLSGGQLQRAALARALAPNPQVLVLDEPVSALDVSVQAQVLDLLAELRAELSLTYLFIAHDLAVVEWLCDRAAVMKDGRIVEEGPAQRLFRDPQHPYTRALVDAVPVPPETTP
jgi:ABC-type glutathione transport system ATPase component